MAEEKDKSFISWTTCTIAGIMIGCFIGVFGKLNEIIKLLEELNK